MDGDSLIEPRKDANSVELSMSRSRYFEVVWLNKRSSIVLLNSVNVGRSFGLTFQQESIIEYLKKKIQLEKYWHI